MAVYDSAGVYVKERDISTIVPAISTTVAALVGYSAKGMLGINLVTNRQQFIQEYGEPVVGNYFHYTALAFLERGVRLYCRRVVNGALYPGMHVMSSDAVDDSQAFDAGQSTPVFYDESGLDDELFSIIAKDPGEWGDDISCVIKNVKTGSETEETEKYTFEIDVYYTDSEGTVSKVESWKVSRKSKLDGYGKQLYLEEKINDYSDYILVYDNTGKVDTVVPKVNATAVSLAGGSDGSTVTPSDIIGVEASKTGWYGFLNTDDVDVRILIGGGFLSTFSSSEVATIQSAMNTIAASRMDCIAVLDIPYAEIDDVDDTVTYRDVTLNLNSSYSALYTPFIKINDAYNDRIVEVPPSGYVAAQMVYNDNVAHVWDAVMGFNRGIVNCLGVSKVYTKGERDTLYLKNINPIQLFRGQGTVIWGQKTQQVKASALDRVNVRRSVLTIEKAVQIYLNDFIGEPNNEITRFRITGVLTEYLDGLSAQGAFQTETGDDGFKVLCDTTNNTPAVIDKNELHVDIFIRPVRTAEFIQLQVIITTTGSSFEELISRGVML